MVSQDERRHMAQRIFVPGLNLATALQTVAQAGAAFVGQALTDPFRRQLQQEVEQGPFEPVPEAIGPVRQETEVYVIPDPCAGAHGGSAPAGPAYPCVAALCRAFTEVVRASGRGIGGLDRYAPNVAYVQRYRPGSLGISSHLDGKRFAYLVAVFTSAGSATFSISHTRSGPPVHTWEAGPGSLVLLRGPHLAGVPNGRPFHAVAGPVDQARYSVTFRMDTRHSQQ
jgi:hypothetical protein